MSFPAKSKLKYFTIISYIFQFANSFFKKFKKYYNEPHLQPPPESGGFPVSLASRIYARILRYPHPLSVEAYKREQSLNLFSAGEPKGLGGDRKAPEKKGCGAKPHKIKELPSL